MQRLPDKGAVFLSYAHEDGQEPADWADGLLRAAGVPVWRDGRDLDTGRADEEIRKEIALCSEGLVILTEEYPTSGFAYPKEFAQFRSQRDATGWEFTVDHSIRTGDGALDLTGPDRLRAGQFDHTNQVDLRDQALAQAYLSQVVQRRLARVLGERTGEPLRLHANSYVTEIAQQAPQHGLFINLDLNKDLTEAKSLEHLGWALPVTSRCLGRLGAPHNPPQIVLSGGAHPSIAVALGAALSVTRYRAEVFAEAKESDLWLDPSVADSGRSEVVEEKDITVLLDDAPRGPVAFFVNFSNREETAAFAELHNNIQGNIATAIRIDRTGPSGVNGIDAGEGQRLAERAVSVIRSIADKKDTDEVHLCVAAPFPIAFHIGRLLNSLTVHLWERGASKEGLRYRRTLTVNGDGEIIQAHPEPSDPNRSPSYR